MGRIRLVGLFCFSFGLLLGISQEAAAQSTNRLAKTNDDKGDLSLAARTGAPHPVSTSRRPEIFYCETADTSCRTTQDTFPVADLRDLFVFVVWPGVSGQHVQTVEFLLPDGSIYMTKKTRFLIGGTAPVAAAVAVVEFKNEVAPAPPAPHLMADANKVHAEGIPTLLMKSRGDAAILTVLPIGGTYITQRSLSGTWRVRVLLDDRLAIESEFTLVPRKPAPAAQTGEETEP